MNEIIYCTKPRQRSKKRNSNYFQPTIIITAVLLLGILLGSLITTFVYNKQSVFSIKTSAVDTEKTNNNSWELMLVNPTHPIPENYTPELMTLSNGNQVDSRIYPQLQKMFDDARAEGLYPEVTSGYRSIELQQQLYENEIAIYEAQGYSYDDAKEIAKHWVTVPGTSEHHTGFAVDISADEYSGQSSEEIYPWFIENSYKYGFILRYPEDKTDITGINYEPWHYRYVGKEVAKEIHEQGICFEEYLENAR